MGDIYEPWLPEIGDRVRLHWSPECQASTVDNRTGRLDNHSATVISIDRSRDDGHFYAVVEGDAVGVSGRFPMWVWAAAIEMEKLYVETET